jgi:FixJ family two-component response regulator
VTQPATISIVDDDEDVRLALQSFLRSAGHDVLVFDRAEAFLASLETSVPHCLITDLHMPGMDGLALQEELGRSGRTFPIVVMTAFPTPEAEERAAKLGATAFLSKPIDCEQLLQLVELSLGASDARQSD